MLDTLAADVLLNIFILLDVEDIHSIRLTCRYLSELSRVRSVWHTAFSRHVLSNGIPVPSFRPFRHEILQAFPELPTFVAPHHITKLSSEDLEIATLSALKLHRTWTSQTPVSINYIKAEAQSWRVFFLDFLRISSTATSYGNAGSEEEVQVDDGRYLAFFGYTSVSGFRLIIWDTDSVREKEPSFYHPVDSWTLRERVRGFISCDLRGLEDEDSKKLLGDNPNGSLFAVASSYHDETTDETSRQLRVLYFSSPTSHMLYSKRVEEVQTLPLDLDMRVLAIKDHRVVLQVSTTDNPDTGRMVVRDWVLGWPSEKVFQDRKRVSCEVELDPSQYGVGRRVVSVQIVHDWVLVFRERTLEMYFVPYWLLDPIAPLCESRNVLAGDLSIESAIVSSLQSIKMVPIFVHKLAWAISSLSFSERYSWRHEQNQEYCVQCNGTGYFFPNWSHDSSNARISRRVACACVYRPLSIAIRFDSYFPWPVNLLHHFVLSVNPLYSPSEIVSSLSSPSSMTHDMDGQRKITLRDKLNVPYVDSPVLTHTQPSALRLFGKGESTMGTFGTLLWMDSEGVSRTVQSGRNLEDMDEGVDAAATGERVAGRRLPLPTPRLSINTGTNFSNSSDHRQRIFSASNSAPSSPTLAIPEPLPPPSHFSTVREDVNNVEGNGKGNIASTSLFATRSREGWGAIAMNERSGRVAAWDINGFIEMWEYF